MTIKMKDIVNLDCNIIDVISPKNPKECCIGMKYGDGLFLGYEGWGDPDIALDPTLTLDVCIDQLNLKGKFSKVFSKYLLNNVHGDCTLTHCMKGLVSLLSTEGELYVEYLATADLAKTALDKLYSNDFPRAQMLEKYCFRQPLDKSGLTYQQVFLNSSRIKSLVDPSCSSSILKASCLEAGYFPPSIPDDIRLDGISDEDWKRRTESVPLKEDFYSDRPVCILCNKVVTKMDHNRQLYSKYCKDHYYLARIECDKQIIAAYTGIILFKKNSVEDSFKNCFWTDDILPMALCGYNNMGLDVSKSTILDRKCDGKNGTEIWKMLEELHGKTEGVIIVGDWTIGNKLGIDTFDMILKYAEDSYRKIRQYKSFSNGYYIVLMSNEI